MIVRLTYRSGPYRVKGYVGLPPGCGAPPEALQSFAAARGGLPAAELPVDVVAEAVRVSYPPRTILRPASSEAASAVPPRATSPRPDGAPYPALVLCRGGVGGFGRVRPHWVDDFAARGFVVFAPCYRGNEGGEGRDEFGGADREDVAEAIALLRTFPFVDRDRVSIAGFSRGSINAARAAVDAPDAVRRLVLWSGVADLARTYEERVDLRRTLKRILGGTPAKRPEAYRERSPLALAPRLRCPTLVVHGAEDPQVDVGHGLAMYEALRALGAPVDLHLYEGFAHLFPYAAHQAAVDRMAAWLLE